MEFFCQFCIWRLDFDAVDYKSYKECYSDDDELFSLDDASHSDVRDIREAWNAQTSVQEPLTPTEINTENSPKSSNSFKCNKDHSNDIGDEILRGSWNTHNYIKNSISFFWYRSCGRMWACPDA